MKPRIALSIPAGCFHDPDADRSDVAAQDQAVAVGQSNDPEPAQRAEQDGMADRADRELPDAAQPADQANRQPKRRHSNRRSGQDPGLRRLGAACRSFVLSAGMLRGHRQCLSHS